MDYGNLTWLAEHDLEQKVDQISKHLGVAPDLSSSAGIEEFADALERHDQDLVTILEKGRDDTGRQQDALDEVLSKLDSTSPPTSAPEIAAPDVAVPEPTWDEDWGLYSRHSGGGYEFAEPDPADVTRPGPSWVAYAEAAGLARLPGPAPVAAPVVASEPVDPVEEPVWDDGWGMFRRLGADNVWEFSAARSPGDRNSGPDGVWGLPQQSVPVAAEPDLTEIFADLGAAAGQDVEEAYRAVQEELTARIVTELWAGVRTELLAQLQDHSEEWSDQGELEAAARVALEEALDGFFETIQSDGLPLSTTS